MKKEMLKGIIGEVKVEVNNMEIKETKFSMKEINFLIWESGVLDEEYGYDFEEYVTLQYKAVRFGLTNEEFNRSMILLKSLEFIAPEHEELFNDLMMGL